MAETDTNAGSSLSPNYADQIAERETHGAANPDTTGNPHSTALGRHQFLAGTWMAFAKANPGLFANMDDQQILDKRTDPNYSRQATDWYGRYNAGILQQRGFAPTAANLGLAHSFGGVGAAGLLAQPDSMSLHDALVATQGQDAATRILAANPAYNGMTVGQIKGRYAGMGGGTGSTTPAPVTPPVTPPAPAPVPAPASTASNSPLTRLALLNNLLTPTQAPVQTAAVGNGPFGWANALRPPTIQQQNPIQLAMTLQALKGNNNPLLTSLT